MPCLAGQTECQTCTSPEATSWLACTQHAFTAALSMVLVCIRQETHLSKAGRVAVHVLLEALHLGLGAVADLRPLVVLLDLHIQAAHTQAVAAAEAASLLHLRCEGTNFRACEDRPS